MAGAGVAGSGGNDVTTRRALGLLESYETISAQTTSPGNEAVQADKKMPEGLAVVEDASPAAVSPPPSVCVLVLASSAGPPSEAAAEGNHEVRIGTGPHR